MDVLETRLLGFELVARTLASHRHLFHSTSFGRLLQTSKTINSHLSNPQLTRELFRGPYIEKWGPLFSVPESRWYLSTTWASGYFSTVRSPLPWLASNNNISLKSLQSALSHWVKKDGEVEGIAFLVSKDFRKLLQPPEKKTALDVFMSYLKKNVFSKNLELPERKDGQGYYLTNMESVILSLKKTWKFPDSEKALEHIVDFTQTAPTNGGKIFFDERLKAITITLAALMGVPYMSDFTHLRALMKEYTWFTQARNGIKVGEDNSFWAEDSAETCQFVACISFEKGHVAFLAASSPPNGEEDW